MKPYAKILWWNIGIAALLCIIWGIYNPVMALAIFGALNFVFGLINLLVAGILYAAQNQKWAKGFLLCSGILLLIGMGVCSPFWMGAKLFE